MFDDTSNQPTAESKAILSAVQEFKVSVDTEATLETFEEFFLDAVHFKFMSQQNPSDGYFARFRYRYEMIQKLLKEIIASDYVDDDMEEEPEGGSGVIESIRNLEMDV